VSDRTRLANPDPSQVAQALNAIAIEVERIGEGQRFLTKLMAGRGATVGVKVAREDSAL